MANIDLRLDTISKGRLEQQFQGAMKTISDSMSNTELVGKAREITIKIKITPGDDGFAKTETMLTTKIPVVSLDGIVWQQTSGTPFLTKEFSGEARQAELELTSTNVTPIRPTRD